MRKLLATATAAVVLSTTSLVAPIVAQDAPRIDDFDNAKRVSSLPFVRTVLCEARHPRCG